MGAPDRIVRRLRLRASSQQAVQHACTRLEDALRCASLPDTGERLLLVRRLDLGRLPEGLSAQSLSLLLEQRVRALGGTWVHGNSSDAGNADCVWFDSRLQAAQCALSRAAEGRELIGWHWRLALPGVSQRMAPTELLHVLIGCLADEESAPASLPALVASAVESGHGAWLIRNLSFACIEWIIDAAGIQSHATSNSVAAQHTMLATSIAYRFNNLQGQSQHVSVPHFWPQWLHATLRAARWAAQTPIVELSAQSQNASAPAQLAIVRAEVASETRIISSCEPLVATDAEALSTDAHVSPEPVPGSFSNEQVCPQETTVALRSETPAAFGNSVDSGVPATSLSLAPIEQDPFDPGLPTSAGGLLFLLNILARLGFAAWQAQHAESPIVVRILTQAMRRMKIDEADPHWQLLATLPQSLSIEARTWQTPPLWNDPQIVVRPDQDLLHADDMARLWLLACRRYARRIARIGMTSLAMRRAHLRWSATHIDISFALSDADMRIRRAALDLDPGWLPWCGHVVAFHYLHGDFT